MRYWYDTEFREDGRIIDMISIGVVAEDGREYYAVSSEFNKVRAFVHPWLYENVLPHLPWKPIRPHDVLDLTTAESDNSTGLWKPRGLIAQELACFFLNGCSFENGRHTHKCFRDYSYYVTGENGLADTTEKPELWAYYADYDHVVLCQLFGTMMNLPKGMPMYTRDLKQLLDMFDVPKFVPETPHNEHHALADARWNRELHRHIWNEALAVHTELLGERP